MLEKSRIFPIEAGDDPADETREAAADAGLI